MILRSGCSPSESMPPAHLSNRAKRRASLFTQRGRDQTRQVEMTESTDSQTEERSQRRQNGETRMARADFAVRAPADGRATRGADRIDQSTSPLLRFASVCSVSPFVNSRSPLRITFVSSFLPTSGVTRSAVGPDARLRATGRLRRHRRRKTARCDPRPG